MVQWYKMGNKPDFCRDSMTSKAHFGATVGLKSTKKKNKVL